MNVLKKERKHVIEKKSIELKMSRFFVREIHYLVVQLMTFQLTGYWKNSIVKNDRFEKYVEKWENQRKRSRKMGRHATLIAKPYDKNVVESIRSTWNA